jgi:signal peptidase
VPSTTTYENDLLAAFAAEDGSATDVASEGRSTGSTRGDDRGPGWRRIVVVSSAIVVAVALLWPAQFGGLFGETLVNGTSMEPNYKQGDLVVTIRQPSYSKGDVVSLHVPAGQPGANSRALHTIVAVDAAQSITTKSDASSVADPWKLTNGDIMGRALFSIPAIGPMLASIGTPIALGLTSGLLATLLLWRFGSAGRGRRRRGSPLNRG